MEIECHSPLRHQDILGSLFSINIDPHMYGDIIIINNHYYIFILKHIAPYLLSHLVTIGKYSVSVKEVESNIVSNYHQEYEEITLIMSSLRLDTMLSTLTHLKRSDIQNRIQNKEVILNYQIATNTSYVIKENDVFSLRKYGKYKFIGVDKTTKKNNLVVRIIQYK